MCNPVEWLIQDELNSFPAYGHCSMPAKTRKTPTLDPYSSDELNQFSFIGHGSSSISLWTLDRLKLSALLADMVAPIAYAVRDGQVTRQSRAGWSQSRDRSVARHLMLMHLGHG
jgi:hypothetical protein